MARISEQSQQQLKERIILLLRQNAGGLSEQEIATLLNIERRRLNNYLNELQVEGKLDKEGRLWYLVPQEKFSTRALDLEDEEAVILYLAARLFVKQRDTRIELAENVLMRLADILSQDMGLGDDVQQVALELSRRPKDPHYEDVFRTIIRGYVFHRKVKITYQPYKGRRFETIFAPYLLEPSAIGYSTYAIGYSSIVDALRTYKIECIAQAEVLNHEAFQVPNDFGGLGILQNAWSIYYGEDVVRVILRFHPDVTKRVRETYWHPSQQAWADPDQFGYWCVQFEVADTTDIKPWIRTWGANCEVLDPQELRDELTGEARRLAQLYGWQTSHNQTRPTSEADHSRFADIFGE